MVASKTGLVGPEYREWLGSLKSRVRQVQLKAAVAVNQELLLFYWELGGQIVERQTRSTWGDGFLKQLSADLIAEFPDIKGFSKRNLELIRKWVLYWSSNELGAQSDGTITKQPVSQLPAAPIVQIPWGHNLLIVRKCENLDEATFYIENTLAHGWSRSVLTHQIESGIWQRKGFSPLQL